MRYTYHISTTGISGTYSEIYIIPPILKKTLQTTVDKRYCYRWSCSEIKITKKLNSSIYGTLLSWFTDDTKFTTQIFLKIYRGTTSGTLIYTGYFSVTDIELNKENGYVIFTPITYDEYSEFDDKGSIDNILDLATLCSDNNVLWNGIPLTTDPTWTNVNFDTFASSLLSITDARDTDPINARTCYLGIFGILKSGEVYEADITAYSKTSGTNPIMYIKDSSGTKISNDRTLSAAGLYTFTISANSADGNNKFYIESGQVEQVRFSVTFKSMTKKYHVYGNTSDFLFKNCTLFDLIYDVVDTAGLSFTSSEIKSTFFFNDALPSDAPSSIDTYMTSNPGHNYVTEADNELNDIKMIPFSELSAISETEGVLKWNFSKLMIALNFYFNVYYYIDADGDLRIEHFKYFEEKRTSGIDVTGAPFISYKPEVGNKKYRQIKERIFGREVWDQTYNYYLPYDDVIYNVYATVKEQIEYNHDLIYTDIQYLNDQVDTINPGLILATTTQVGSNYKVDTEELFTSLFYSNGKMSFKYLHPRYWDHGRYAGTGIMNGVARNFASTIELIESVVRFPYTSDLDDYGYITTSFGNGVIDEYERNLDTDVIEAKLLYSAY